jgi:two-component system, LuxR family, response regulator FixJ
MMLNPVVYLVDPANNDRLYISKQLQEANLEHQSFADAEGFISAFNPHRIGCVFSELKLGPATAFQLVKRLRELNYSLPVILLTSHATVPLTAQAFKAGVFDVMVKPSESFQLWECATRAFESHGRDLEEAYQRNAVKTRMTSLSRQELQVLQMLLEGEPNKRIASRLGVSPRTVVFRRKSLMDKMHAKSVAELAILVNAASVLPKRFHANASLLEFHTEMNLLETSKQFAAAQRWDGDQGSDDRSSVEDQDGSYCGNHNG